MNVNISAGGLSRVVYGTPDFNTYYMPIGGAAPIKVVLVDISTIVDVGSRANPQIDALLHEKKNVMLGDKVSLTPDQALRAKAIILPPTLFPEHWPAGANPSPAVAPLTPEMEAARAAVTFTPGGTAVNVGYTIGQLLGPKVEMSALCLTGNSGGAFDALSAEACRQSNIRCAIDLGDKVWQESVSYVVNYPTNRIIARVGGDPRQFLTADLFKRTDVRGCLMSADVIVVTGNIEAKAPEFAEELFRHIGFSGATLIYMMPTDRDWARKNSEKVMRHVRDADLVVANAEEFVAGFGGNIDTDALMSIEDPTLRAVRRQEILVAALRQASAIFKRADVYARSYAFMHRQNLMVTDGDQGAFAADANGGMYFPANKVPVVSTVGAGDATTGAKIAGCLCGAPNGSSVDTAQQVGALTVQYHGARVPHLLAALRAVVPDMARPFDEIQEAVRTGQVPGGFSGVGWVGSSFHIR